MIDQSRDDWGIKSSLLQMCALETRTESTPTTLIGLYDRMLILLEFKLCDSLLVEK